MKLRVKNPAQHSSNLIVPFDGQITIDANGEFEVSEKCANFLLANDAVYENAEVTSGGAGSGSNAQQNGETDENQLIIDGLKDIQLEDAVKLAQDSGYPEEEYQKFAKKQKLMAAYLIKKFKETLANPKPEEKQPEDVKVDDKEKVETEADKNGADDQSGDQK